MIIELNEHESWTKNCLMDRLKQHLATFEASITSSDDKKSMITENTSNRYINHSFLEH